MRPAICPLVRLAAKACTARPVAGPVPLTTPQEGSSPMSEFNTYGFTGLKTKLGGVNAFLFKVTQIVIEADDSRREGKSEWDTFSTEPGRLDMEVMNLPRNSLAGPIGPSVFRTSYDRSPREFEGSYRLAWSRYGSTSVLVVLTPMALGAPVGTGQGRQL